MGLRCQTISLFDHLTDSTHFKLNVWVLEMAVSTGERDAWAWCGSLNMTLSEARTRWTGIGDVIQVPSVLTFRPPQRQD